MSGPDQTECGICGKWSSSSEPHNHANHSCGPWWISDNHSDVRPEAIHAAGHNTIVATTWATLPKEQRKANARLISHAPELFELCKIALELGLMHDSSDCDQWAARAELRMKEIIKDVEGRND